MRSFILLPACCLSLQVFSQTPADTNDSKKEPAYIFESPRAINANTVNLISKGILEFKVVHNFGDLAGDLGGLKNFYGLDNAVDIRIGFQYGLSKRLNIAAARYKGSGVVQKMYEANLKYLVMQQMKNDPAHPLSLALFANTVVNTMKAGNNPESENAISDEFSDRLSYTFQLMLARRFGPVSLQLNPTIVHRNFALPYDDKTMFAMGGVIKIQLKDRLNLLFDYFHTFRGQSSIDSFQTRGIKFYDAFGVGIEILTGGHVFHINFTNTTDILENRFIPRTVTSWGKGQFRWGFIVSRDFDLLWKKRKK